MPNKTNFNYFNEGETLFDEVKTFIWNVVLPIICSLGILTNLINFYIFSRRRTLRNQIYRYLELHSLVEIFYLAISGINFVLMAILKKNNMESSYFSRFFELYAYRVLTSVLALLNIYIELIIALKRILIMKYLFQNWRFKLNMLICLLLSLVFSILPNIPTILFTKIQLNDTGSNYTYSLNYEKLIESRLNRIIIALAGSLRGILLPLTLLVLTLVMFQLYKKLLEKKQDLIRGLVGEQNSLIKLKQISSSSRESTSSESVANIRIVSYINRVNSITRLSIMSNFLFILSNSSVVIYILVILFNPKKELIQLTQIVTTLVLYLTHGITILIYYNFDKLYKRQFRTRFGLK